MANVLVLKSSINGETSLTNQLINEFRGAPRRDTAIGSSNTISAPWRCQRWIAPCSPPCAGSGSAACYPRGGRPLRPAYRRVKGQRPAGDRRADV